MPVGKKWRPEEIRLAAVAWINTCTTNNNEDNNRTVPETREAIIAQLQQLAPVNHESGHYHERGGKNVLDYLRDFVFKEVKKFNDALRIVYQAKPTEDVMEQQKINMAVAIHLGLTKSMDYHFRNTNPQKWRCYTAWIELQKVTKFKFDVNAPSQSTDSNTRRRPNQSSTSGTLRADTPTPIGTAGTTTTTAATAPVPTVARAAAATPAAAAADPTLGFPNAAAASLNMTTHNNSMLQAQLASFQGHVSAFQDNQEILRRAAAANSASPMAQEQQSMVSFYKRKLDEQITESASLFQTAAMYKRQLDEKDATIKSLQEQVSALKKRKRKRDPAESAGGGAASVEDRTTPAAASAVAAALVASTEPATTCTPAASDDNGQDD